MNNSYNIARNTVGSFDFSDRGKFYISGGESLTFLNRLTTSNIDSLYDGRIIDTLFLRDDGSILAVVWILKDENKFIIITDAAKRVILFEWLNKSSEGYDVQIEDQTDILGYISVIGPNAQKLTRTIAGDDILGIPYSFFEHNTIINCNCLLCRFGHTGEYEYSFILPYEKCEQLAELIMEKGREYDIEKCDTKVVDALMLEMKSVNTRNDILEDTTPIQAGLHWMIDFHKDDFIGKGSILNEKKSVPKKLLSLLFEDGPPVLEKGKLFIDDREVGVMVNSCFSPSLKKDIGHAYIEEKFAWVGIDFYIKTVEGDRRQVRSVSAPLLRTKSMIDEAS